MKRGKSRGKKEVEEESGECEIVGGRKYREGRSKGGRSGRRK